MNNSENIGIAGIGIYVPKGVHTSRYIAEKSGIPVEVIEEKFGIVQKHKAGPDEHPSDMAIVAAKQALGDFDPMEIDMIIYCGSEYKDYYVWSLAAKIQHEIGAKKAFAFEVMALCASGVLSLKIAKDMMLREEEIKNVLLVAASKELDLVDYTNDRSRFMFNFGDGAAAVLLKKNYKKNRLLETCIVTDGSFSEDVMVIGGGSKFPPSYKTIDKKLHRLDVPDPKGMKERLDKVSETNFIKVIKTCVEKSGYTIQDVNFLAPIHMKKSIHSALLKYLGLKEENSFYLENYGHVQSADAIIILKEAQNRNLLKNGDLVVMVGAGTGYTWGATALKWGES